MDMWENLVLFLVMFVYIFCVCYNCLKSRSPSEKKEDELTPEFLKVEDIDEQTADFSEEHIELAISEPTDHLLSKDHEHIKEAVQNISDKPPAHYLWKIENFSQLSNAKRPYIESRVFYGEKFKWRLILDLQSIANKKLANGNEKGHISLHLVPSQPTPLPFYRKVLVCFKLFVYNQIQDNYLIFQAEQWKNFRGSSGWGFDELLPLDVFNDPSNGYLINDCCIFGAEISIYETKTLQADCTSLAKELGETYTWKIQNFEKMKEEDYQSAVFASGSHKWRLVVYPKCSNLALHISLDDSKTPKSYFEYVVIVKDQVHGKDHKFYGSSDELESEDFIPLSKLNDKSKGYLYNDAVILQVQISYMAIAMALS